MCHVVLCLALSALWPTGAGSGRPASAAPTRWSTTVADSLIKRFPDPDAIHWIGQKNHFSWQAGYVMFAMEKLWRRTGDQRYFDYIKRYVDQQVDERGNIPDFVPDALDNFIPGYAILFMYEQTKLEKYRIAATKIRDGFRDYPRNADGSFWHTARMKHQMWVDGVFMGQMFLARYGATLGDRDYAFGEVARQMKLALEHCRKPNGLLLHGWDESRAAAWADRQTGQAPEVWSEGLGWYAVLSADVFDYLPNDHPDRPLLLEALRTLCQGLKHVQDPNTGMWCQVVDRPGQAGNWNETSGTGMFTYLIRSAIDKGYISRAEYLPVVQKAYAGLITKAVPAADGGIDIKDCSSIGIKNSYKAYINCPKEVNPFAPVTSFILGTMIMETPENGSGGALLQAATQAPSSSAAPLMALLDRFTAPDVPVLGPGETPVDPLKWDQPIPPNLPGRGRAQHPMLYIGEGYNKIFLVNEGKVLWTYSTGGGWEYDDVWMLSNGNILFTRMQYVAEVTPRKEVVWRYDAPAGTEIHACQPIGLDKVMFVLNANPPRLFIVNIKTQATEVEHTIPYEPNSAVHGQFRRARYTAQGTYLLPYLSLGKVVEYDKDFREIWRYDVQSPWAAIRLKNGNTLITSERDIRTLEVTPRKEIVWELTPADLPPGQRFINTQSCTRLANGNTIICSRGEGGKGPQLVEVTKDKKVVWILHDWATFGPATAVQILDDPGFPENPGQSEH